MAGKGPQRRRRSHLAFFRKSVIENGGDPVAALRYAVLAGVHQAKDSNGLTSKMKQAYMLKLMEMWTRAHVDLERIHARYSVDPAAVEEEIGSLLEEILNEAEEYDLAVESGEIDDDDYVVTESIDVDKAELEENPVHRGNRPERVL